LQLIRSATQFGPDFAFNSFSNRPFLQLNRSAKCALALPLRASIRPFSVLLAFLSLVNGWADRFGRLGDQRVKRVFEKS
jgi:hypothetical protein